MPRLCIAMAILAAILAGLPGCPANDPNAGKWPPGKEALVLQLRHMGEARGAGAGW